MTIVVFSPSHASLLLRIDECAIISPKRTHYKRVVEIISPEYLRKKLKVDDGAKFLINVDLGDS